MLKLYRQDDTGLRYWETWTRDGVHVIHWGVAGDRGQHRQTPYQALVEHEIASRRAEGFSERDALTQIVLQYRIEGGGSVRDLDRRHRLERLMNEVLGWTGLGHCDGGDIGSGTINVFCFTVEPALAADCIVEALRVDGQLEGAVIAERRRDDFVVHHPPGYEGPFRVL